MYTYATPNVTSLSDLSSSGYDTIFNMAGAEDTVPKAPLAKCDFGKYGTTFILPSKSNDFLYRDKLAAMRPYFRAIYGEEFQPYANGALTSTSWSVNRAPCTR